MSARGVNLETRLLNDPRAGQKRVAAAPRRALPPGALLCDRLVFGGAKSSLPGDSAAALAGRGVALDPRSLSHRTKLAITAVYCVGMIAAGLMGGAAGPATLQLAEQLGIVHNVTATGTNAKDLTQMGVANTINQLVATAGCLIGGWLVNRTRHWHWLMALMQCWVGIAWVLQCSARSFEEFVVVSVLIGIWYSMTSVTSQSALTWIWGDDVAPYMQVDNAAYGFGALLGPLVVAANIHYDGGFHLAFFAIGFFNVLSGLLFLLVPSPTSPAPVAEHSDASAPGSTERGTQMLIMFAVFYSFFFWYETTEPALAGWVSSYVTLVDGVQPTAAAALPSVYWLFFTGARLASAVAGMCNIRSSDLLLVSMFGALGALGCLYAGSHVAARNGSTWLIWAGCALFGLFQGPMWPAMESLLCEDYGIHLRTADTVVILIVSRLGSSVQQLFFSWLLSRSHTAHLYVLALAAFMGAVALTYVLMKCWALPRTGLVAHVGRK